ncbi:hypothetical protein SEUCBS140593_001244 [Sporothrix eucalyptigena]|uniref:Ars-binding protein n=1 Tax=Sporothrix eucalyptigena TaxID=1812306 RepID=A0ABP0AWM0_9PEZI
MLPERNVTAATIENAYVSFILACNPAVAPTTDTTALREAFRTPPRSDGKSFSIFTLYQLICQLEDREIKTWAELALKLGVEPPDQDKGQSSQKIQQYAVRLKRWMHSMHVNAFFDYLMDRPHPYWTNIPTSPYPVSEHLRDGVAAKDDMALRALIPEIKPRRGRRRPDEEDQDFVSGRSPPQRPRLDEYVDDLSASAARWSAHPDGSGEFGFPGHGSDMTGVVQSHLQTPPPAWSSGLDGINTPLSAYPQSAITPSTRMNYWADEPKSAITPSSAHSSRRPGRRHGAKVVSSAWRSSGAGGSGKTRGRPPINRNGNHHTQPSATSQDATYTPASTVGHTTPTYPPVTSEYPPHMEPTTSASLSSMQIPELTSMPTLTGVGTTTGLPTPVPMLTMPDNMSPPSTTQPRASRPNNLSLQVPQRQGAEVRLASPPMTNLANSMSSSTLAMHPQSIPTTCASEEAPILLSKYDPAALDIPLSMDFTPDQRGHHSQTPSLVDTHSPATGTNLGTGTTGATSVTPEIAPNVTVDMNFESTRKPGEGRNVQKPSQRPQSMYSMQFGNGKPGNRTNVDEIEAYFMTEVFAATWYDEEDRRIPPCSVEEAAVLVDVVIEDLIKGASTNEAFLINLAALAGGKILMSTTDTRIKRIETTAEYTKYDFSWELRFGDIVGQFSIIEVVEHSRWKNMTTDVKASVARAVGLKTMAEERAEMPLPPKSTDPFHGVAATLDGGRIRFPMQGGSLNGGGRYGAPLQAFVPSVTPGSQNYTPNGTPYINFGTPAGTHSSIPGGSATSAGTRRDTTPTGSATSAHDENKELAAMWEKKYRHLLHLLYKRDRQLDRTRYAVLDGLKKTYEHDDTRDV